MHRRAEEGARRHLVRACEEGCKLSPSTPQTVIRNSNTRRGSGPNTATGISTFITILKGCTQSRASRKRAGATPTKQPATPHKQGALFTLENSGGKGQGTVTVHRYPWWYINFNDEIVSTPNDSPNEPRKTNVLLAMTSNFFLFKGMWFYFFSLRAPTHPAYAISARGSEDSSSL
jgi:hypothetical protein